LVNDILHEFLKNFVIIYLNDIIIYSKTKKNYVQYINKVLKILKNKDLRLKPKKCKWHKQEINFLRHIVGINKVKSKFRDGGILTNYDPGLDTIIKTNISNKVIEGILSQRKKNGKLRPVAFFLKKLISAKLNYEIYNKELLAIIAYFKK